MLKKMMLLLLLTGFLLSIGLTAFATDTANPGNTQTESATTINTDSNSSTTAIDSDRTEGVTDSPASSYRSHRRHSYHHDVNWGPGAKGMLLFMLFSMMIVIMVLV